MLVSICAASNEFCTIWVRSISAPNKVPTRKITAMATCTSGALLVLVHSMTRPTTLPCSFPRGLETTRSSGREED